MIKSKIVGLVVPRVSVTNPTSAEAPHIPAWAAAVGPAGDKLFFRGTNGQPLRNATSKWGEMKLVPFSLMGLSWSIQKWTCAPEFLASLGKSTDGGHGTTSAISVRSLDPRLLTSPSNDRSTQTCCDCCGQNVNQTCGKNPIKNPMNFAIGGPKWAWESLDRLDHPKWTHPGVFMRLFAQQQRSGSHWAKQAMYWSQRANVTGT